MEVGLGIIPILMCLRFPLASRDVFPSNSEVRCGGGAETKDIKMPKPRSQGAANELCIYWTE